MCSKRHLDAVSERLRKYEEALAAPKFKQLNLCNVCDTVETQCHRCLFNGSHAGYSGCIGPDGKIGVTCRTKLQQRIQLKHLLKRLDERGYEFK